MITKHGFRFARTRLSIRGNMVFDLRLMDVQFAASVIHLRSYLSKDELPDQADRIRRRQERRPAWTPAWTGTASRCRDRRLCRARPERPLVVTATLRPAPESRGPVREPGRV
jgi:hypothetical protein